jgi:hypothetical protein
VSAPGQAIAAAVLWRGIVYGAADGLLLSAFPILAVFAGADESRMSRRKRGTAAVGAFALLASLLMTAVYHLGYSGFRSPTLAKPVAGTSSGSCRPSSPLNPIGAPIAHAGMHVTAVLHSYETETFLPPHR